MFDGQWCSFAQGVDWPAWVQAVGSVAAIFISVWVARAADRRTEKVRRERDQVQRQVIARVVEAVQADIAGLQSDLSTLSERKEWGQVHTVITSTMYMLNALDLAHFRTAEDVRSFFYIRNTTRRALHFVDILLREPGNAGAVLSLNVECEMVLGASSRLLESIDGRPA